MILTAILSVLSFALNLVVSALPTGTLLPANFSDFITDLISYAWSWNWLISIPTLLSVLSAIIIFFLAEITWRSGKYLVAVFRGM